MGSQGKLHLQNTLFSFALKLTSCSVIHQYSGGIDWRQKLDMQRGAVLANELRNNACKLAKWTVQSLLAGSDQMKFG